MRMLLTGAVLALTVGCDLDKDTGDDIDDGEPYVGDTLELCDADAPDDAVWISSASISGDTLTIDLSYGGGCEAHQLRLCWDGAIMESYPMQANLWVSHNANGDACEAEVGETMTVDISSIGATPTSLHLEGWDGELMYE